MLDYNIRDGRTYMYDKNEPLFAFGHGLTYTIFDYNGLKPDKPAIKDGETVNVTVSLKNSGNYDSDEVVQLYASFPNSKVEQPVKALKGFKRVFIPKGNTVNVVIPLKADDLKYWDVDKHSFVLQKGDFELLVGASSDDIRLKQTMKIE